MKILVLTLLVTGLASVFAQGQKVSSDARDHLPNIDAYIANRKQGLAILKVDTCIFGCPQDPVKAEEEKKITPEKIEAEEEKPAIPLAKVLEKLPVSGVDYGRKKVLLKGKPPVVVGQVLELKVAGEAVRIRLEAVRSDGVFFRDLKTMKYDTLPLKSNRDGIERETGKKNGSGIKPDNPSDPIEIEIDL